MRISDWSSDVCSSDLLQIIQPGKAEPMVRVAWNDAVLIKRLLDIGTQTLLVPFVQNAEQAKAAVAATRYPPTGIRGVMSSARMNHFNKIKDYYANAHKEMCVAVQQETRQEEGRVGKECVSTRISRG